MKYDNLLLFVFGVLTTIFFSSACNLTQGELHSQATEIAGRIFQTQTAEVPTHTSTPTIAPTPITQTVNLPTSAPEKTAVPTNELESNLVPTIRPVFAWIPEVVYKSQAAGYFANLAIDSQDNLHLGFFQDFSDMVWWVQSLNNQWVAPEQVTGGVGRGFHTSMVLDSTDRPHFAYHAIDTKKQEPYLYYKFWTGNNWKGVFKNIDYRVHNTDISMALGPDDAPHFFFIEDYADNLIYSRFGSYGFENQVVGRGNPASESFPIIIDQLGNPHMLFQSVDQGLIYATKRPDTWNWVVVDPGTGAGQFSDIALDAAGGIHVAYNDANEGDLKYAFLSGDVFVQQLVDSQGDVGQYSSIAVDSSGNIHIGYYDSTNNALKYAYGKDGQWAIDTVDNNGSVGEYASIALDSKDRPYIAYFDQENEDLKLARSMPLMP
jgi:hypothetical protein